MRGVVGVWIYVLWRSIEGVTADEGELFDWKEVGGWRMRLARVSRPLFGIGKGEVGRGGRNNKRKMRDGKETH